MKRTFCIIYVIFLVNFLEAKSLTEIKIKSNVSAITYELNGGRFGDNLFSYSRAKWLAYQYDIPIIYFPFPYADQLLLHEKEVMYNDDIPQQFSSITRLSSKTDFPLYKNNDTLYISHWKTDVTIDWNDKKFVEQLKTLIAPIHLYEKVAIPDGYVSVAVHVRNGGGHVHDHAIEKARCPLRFVPDEFFIDQIRHIAHMFEGQPLYVHIFTDHQQPSVLLEKFKGALRDKKILFGCRIEGNAHNANVLDDFFAMMDFQCLIRPGSHFSRFVERLGNNQLVIYPAHSRYISKDLSIIDTIGIKTRTAKGWKTRMEIIA
jgi:hypothetical protein